MMVLAALPALVGSLLVAQMQPASMSGQSGGVPVVLNNGACMDSPRPVPEVLQPPIVRSTQITRIDKVTSTATMLYGQVIGFLYTLGDGSTWLSQRSSDYMSAASASAINRVLAATHMPDQPISAFPPAMKYGVATKYEEYFRVQIPATAMTSLQIRLDPCVAWPVGVSLPDPAM